MISTLIQIFAFQANINDISALSGLTQLQEFSLWENQISYFWALSGLKQLKKIYLHNNPISEDQIAWLKQQLPNTEIIY